MGDIVTAAHLNTYHRDNLNDMSDHKHSGAPGDGSANLTRMFTITFDHISDPAAPGLGKTILYAKAGGLFFRRDTGAVTQLSIVGHTH